MLPFNKNNKSNSSLLRKNMTPEEKRLWYDLLKRLPLTVRRQYCIGNYIVDFYIPSKKIVIEIDGIQHNSNENSNADKKRDEYLAKLDIKVLRYSNQSINSCLNIVAQELLNHLELNFNDLKPIPQKPSQV